MAPPSQTRKGDGHICPNEESEVEAIMNHLKLSRVQSLENSLRESAELEWFRKNIMAFRKIHNREREMVFDLPIFCINLEHRTDRWRKIEIQAEYLGLEIQRFPAIEAQDPNFSQGRSKAYGCRLSHYECLRTAYDLNLDRVIILEDDAVFHRDFILLVKKYMDILDRHCPKWTFLGAGDFAKSEESLIGGHIRRIKALFSNVCYVYNRRNDPNFIGRYLIDKNERYYYRGTDRILNDLNRRGIISYYIPDQPLCVQEYDNYSDLWERNNRDLRWSKHYKKYVNNKNFLYDIIYQ